MNNYQQLSIGFLLMVLLLGSTSCSKFTRLQKRGTLEEKYNAALEYYKNEKYYKASLLFEELIPLYRGRRQAEKAQFYYAYCHYHSGNLLLSAYYFKEFYKTYPRSEDAEEARYMVAVSLKENSPPYNLDQTNTKKAIEAFQQFINTYPHSEMVSSSNAAIDSLRDKLEYKDYKNALLYAKIYRYKAAIVAFDNFSENWPDSDLNEEIYYSKVSVGYKYAKNSIREKKKERYEQVLEYYTNFVDKYPKSDYIKKAESYYEKTRDDLRKLNEGTYG